MDCERFDKTLHLYRRGELSDHEAAELAEHVRTCRRCAETQEKLRELDRYVESVRGISPMLDEPEESTARVMARIRAAEAPARKSPKEMIDRLMEYFLKPGIRYASAAVVVFAVASFSLQYFTILQSIGTLEQRMAATPAPRAKPTVSYAIETEAIRSTTDRHLLRTLEPYQDQVQSDGAVIVELRTLRFLATLVDARASFLARGYMDRDRVDALIREVAKNTRTLIRFANGGD
ncbi:MAG: hypothetical protein FJ217_07575 [Ignavibacteria bacterium]|nr:hypothetical protein [Ignavibacteria bacterium]